MFSILLIYTYLLTAYNNKVLYYYGVSISGNNI